jgi:hypothetical protein
VRSGAGPARLWLLRILVATATALAAGTGFFRLLQDDDAPASSYVQTEALKEFSRTFDEADAEVRPKFTVVFFGDSLALPENILRRVTAVPMQFRRELGGMMRNAGAGEPADLRLFPITYSGLSLWTLYYMTDRIVRLRPDFVVVEFNLYNFEKFWRLRDRKILAAMLPLTRFPEVLGLPMGEAGLAIDEWIFGRAALKLGALPWWDEIQHAQARATQSYWRLGDSCQQIVGPPKLAFRERHFLLEMTETKDPATNRSTRGYARMLLGRSLDGIAPDEPVLEMLSASLQRLRTAGIPVLVYVPPYNVDHLHRLGLLQGSRLEETIRRVREVAEKGGARFADIHALLADRHFRDAMDHLNESSAADGHRILARRLGAAMAEDWHRILAASH